MKEYPKTLYRNVLLVDGKIANWKTGNTHWKDVSTAFMNRQPAWIYNDKPKNIMVKSDKAIVNCAKESNAFFEDGTWYKQFDLHEQYSDRMFKPY